VLTFRGRVIGESIGLHPLRALADAEVWERAQFIANRLHPTTQDYKQLAFIS
jgi:hypothetical protein